MKNEGKNKPTIFENGINDSFRNESAKVGAHSISYLFKEGSKDPDKTFILAHGAMARKETFYIFASELADKNPESRILIVDVPLHGSSTVSIDAVEPMNVHDYAAVLQEFVQSKTLDKTIQGELHWIGWSMGGSIGMLLDLKGVNIDELTLLNASPYWEFTANLLPILDVKTVREMHTFGLVQDLQTNVSEDDREYIISHLDCLIPESGDVMVQDIQGIAPVHYDIRNDIQNINAKTLIISGTEDGLATPEYQDVLNREIPESKLVMFEDNHIQLMKPFAAKKIVSEIESYFSKK